MAEGDSDIRPASEPSAASPEPRRALLLVNKHARSGSASLDDAISVLRRGGVEVTEEDCDSKRPLQETISAHGHRYDCVIVGGGDGTLNTALPGLLETKLPLGILPLGTGNDLARTLGIDIDPVAAAGLIVAGNLRTIDLGVVNGFPFFNVASIGFSAELARELTAEAKRKWGVLGYAITALRLVVNMRPFRGSLEHDGKIEAIKTMQVSIGNGRHYGGGMTVDIAAEPDDGSLYVYSLEIGHWWQMLALFPALRSGTQGERDNVRAFRTTECTVRTRRVRPVNTDGEIKTNTPAHFRIIRRAIQVYAPIGIMQAQLRAT